MRKRKETIISLLIALLLYLAVLFAPIPYSFSAFFTTYSPLLFLLILGLYTLVFQRQGYWGWSLGLFFTAILFALVLSFLWRSGYSDNKIIGGLLPYKDAYYYYNGARLILDGVLLPEYTVQAAGRPLFPGFMASLLLLTGKNLQISMIILIGLLWLTTYLSARSIYAAFGAFPAALYSTLIFLYTQSQIGFLHTEVHGLILGNLGFILIWQVSEKRDFRKLLFALIVLMVAISARAGAFFIFPMLALWAGWFFKGSKKFSWTVFSGSLFVIAISFFSFNTLFSRLVVEPGNQNFGNFAYTLYGQIHGGTGWNRAIRDMGTRDPEIIMEASLQFFKAHPLSLFIGMAKSYRDFFFPQGSGIFSFYGSKPPWLDTVFWLSGIFLLMLAIIRSIRKIKVPINALLLASFIGILLSIPFLPPIDGGRRFYASTMPFFFAFMVLAMAPRKRNSQTPEASFSLVSPLAGLLLLMTVVMPLFIFYLSPEREITEPSCPADQVPYAVRVDPGSYIQIASTSSNTSCGDHQILCLDDFEKNGAEKNIDLLFQELVAQTELQGDVTRIFTANNLALNGRLHFFISADELLEKVSPRTTITGCATELILVEMKSRPILYKIESVTIP